MNFIRKFFSRYSRPSVPATFKPVVSSFDEVQDCLKCASKAAQSIQKTKCRSFEFRREYCKYMQGMAENPVLKRTVLAGLRAFSTWCVLFLSVIFRLSLDADRLVLKISL